jgi:type II secretory pathway component HofQ
MIAIIAIYYHDYSDYQYLFSNNINNIISIINHRLALMVVRIWMKIPMIMELTINFTIVTVIDYN